MDYSSYHYATLPVDDTDLTNEFDSQDYTDVETDNNAFVNQGGDLEYMVFLFKDQYDTDTGLLNLYCRLKSTIAPVDSTVYLQIFNRTTEKWVTVTYDDFSSANIKFALEVTISDNLSDYYDAGNWVACRVYQLGIV